MSAPRMGMSQMNGNNRRSVNINRMPSTEKPTSAQHDDLIKYIYDSWNKVHQEVERPDRVASNRAVYYQEQENQQLKDFEPFDLEAYWGRKVVQTVQTLQNHS